MTSIFNTNHIEITSHRLKLATGAAARGLRLAHLSDWHGKRFPQGRSYIYDLLCEQKADLVLITGDLLHRGQQISAIWDELAAIGRRFRCYFVHGNNEHYHGHCKKVERCLRESGIKVLTNASARFRGLCIVGVDDAIEGKPDTGKAYRRVRRGDTVLVISHAPVLLPRLLAEKRYFDLFLCGHTHGGQICLPGGMPLVIDSPGVPRKFGRGWHQVGPGYMLVNRGLGEHFIRLRLFCPPELAIIDLC